MKKCLESCASSVTRVRAEKLVTQACSFSYGDSVLLPSARNLGCWYIMAVYIHENAGV